MPKWLLLALALLPSATFGEPRLDDLRVTIEGAQILLSFELFDAFDERIVERIQSGLATGFRFEFELLRDRKHWWDAGLRKSDLQVVAMYNAVTDEYLVNYKLEGKLIESRMVRSREELELAMTRFENVPLFSLKEMKPGLRLLVKARANLGSRTFLAFIPRAITTDTLESRKFHIPPPG